MDILSHGLWAVEVGKGGHTQSEKKLNGWWLFWWGVFPDLFAFVPAFSLGLVSLLGGGKFFEQRPGMYEPWTPGFDSLSHVTQFLYQLSHSLIIFLALALTVYFLTKRVPWVMLGWPLHILADIPTHSSIFYQTPAFWPLFDWKFDGFQWGVGHFTLYNYFALAVVGLCLYFIAEKRESKKHGPDNNSNLQ